MLPRGLVQCADAFNSRLGRGSGLRVQYIKNMRLITLRLDDVADDAHMQDCQRIGFRWFGEPEN